MQFVVFEKINKCLFIQGIVQSLSLSMKWNRRFRGLTMYVFNFGVGSLEESVKLSRLVILDFLSNSLSLNTIFSKQTTKKQCFLQYFRCWSCFSVAVLLFWWRNKTYLKRRPLFRSQIFSVSECCDIQGSHLIRYL